MKFTPRSTTMVQWISRNSKQPLACFTLVWLLISSAILYGQCPVDDLAGDLNRSNGELKTFLDKRNQNINSWQTLYKAGENTERVNLASLEKVTKYLDDNPTKTYQTVADEIIQAGGFSKWSNSTASWYDNLPEGLKADIGSVDSDLGKFFGSKTPEVRADLVDAWRLLDDAGRTGLKINVNALEALQNLRFHPKMAALKQAGNITDADLASIQGFSGASFEEVTNQITRLLDNHSSSTLNGFESVINTMKRTSGTQADNAKKGMYWVIRDVADDVDNLAGKNLTLEFGVPNARGNTSRIDVFCSNCDVPNLKIEYKSGSGSISSSTIKEQFIERDLFNANSLDEIQWRMDGTDFTKEKLVQWMTENKSSIENLGYDKIKSFYPNDEFMNATNYADRFINKFNAETMYKSIFK